MSLRLMERNYKNAIDILNSRRRLKRPTAPSESTVSAPVPNLIGIPGAKGKADLRGTPSIVGMKQWLEKIGHSTADVDRLNIIHVAGTKGKGSTCASIESFLRAYGKRTGFPRKTGLYTSPHLIFPEERIRINFQPIARNLFAIYFFQVWDALTENNGSMSHVALPRYLQLLALVSFHAFIKEGVEAAIFETHHGGEYDATNVIEHPIATVITPLGMDHVNQLGPNIENIAWHKAGILKSGSTAISSTQEYPAAECMLRNRANEKGVKIHFVKNDASLPLDAMQLKPDVQRANCSVALAAVRYFLEQKDVPSLSSADIRQGVGQFFWPGRFQVLVEGKFKWFLDGAHNEMSVGKAAEWFVESSTGQRVLIFSQLSRARDTTTALKCLATALSTVHIQHVIFTRYDPRQDFESQTAMGTIRNSDVDYTSDQAFGEIWRRSHANSDILYEPSIEQALESVRKLGAESGSLHTLVTGSQHLVGGALFSLDKALHGRVNPRRDEAGVFQSGCNVPV